MQELASEHGRPKIPANNIELKNFNSIHGREPSSHMVATLGRKPGEGGPTTWQTEIHKQNSSGSNKAPFQAVATREPDAV